ncbi:hypothetical protein MKK63_09385 [Methylobacterium sp. J-088]|uniref:hypothetical protein n=1 Tax=Methylobacterium sp. J-088 TaxID=2836664 RepID=UPI001FB9544E|nr:hypothetical protein [Methylobacterium sp. J-088]MCJ2062921.1 hypothetical protein [Methylobacterium sp. J-088]
MARSDGNLWSIEMLLRTMHARHTIHTLDLFLPDTHLPLMRAAQRLASADCLLLMTTTLATRRALQVYRRLCGIEGLLGDAKTRGLSLEDTRLTAPAKIETLTAVLTLAITLIYRTATAAMGLKAIARKTHGRRGKSWFSTGLDALRGDLLNAPQSAATLWANRCPKRLPAL